MAIADPGIVRRLERELLPSGDLSTEARSGYVRHTVIGSADGPLMVVPSESRRAAAASMIRWTDATSIGDIIRRLGGWAGFSTGLASSRFSHIFVNTEGELHRAASAASGARSISLAATFGPPRPNQKPVVRALTPGGDTVAFGKIGWNDLTVALIRHEAEFLERHRSSFRSISVPGIVGTDDIEHRVAAWMTPELASPRLRRASPPPPAAVAEVAALTEQYRTTLAGSKWRAQLGHRGVPVAVLGLIDGRWADRSLEFGHWHGDWAPWNLGHRSGRLIVWDWERTGPDMPLGFDPLHYEYQRRVATNEHSMEALREAQSACEKTFDELGIAPDVRPVLAVLYLVELTARFGTPTDDEVPAAGAQRGAVHAVLHQAIEHYR